MQLLSVAITLDGRLDWTGLDAATHVYPQGLEGSTPWRTCYKVARSKQGITASLSLTCSNTAIAELTTGCLFVCYKTRADTAMSLRQARQKS